MIVDYLQEFGKANRAAMRDLLIDKFPDTLFAQPEGSESFNFAYST